MLDSFDSPARARIAWRGVGAGSLTTRDDPSAFAPPAAFGPFRVLHQIGVGALGPVFRTYEPTRDRLVAVKVFRLDITPEQAQALAAELSRAADAGLFHPSIVEPIAAGVEGTVAFRAEEYVAAETLDVALRHYAPATLDKVLPFITQLAGAIDFARAAGVGHGALHPRDIFVTPEEARASGFGVVDAFERVGLRAPVRRPYTAPERIDGGAWGTAADIFSLAAITYELLTARRPSGTGAEIGTLSGAAVGQHAEELLAVLACAMDADPGRRHSTALGFVAALEAAARGETEKERPASAPAAAIAMPAAVLPVAIAEPQPENDDDIAAERSEDEAHHELTRREREHAEAAETASLFSADLNEDPEAEADRLMIDAAAVASDDSLERGLASTEADAWELDRRNRQTDRELDEFGSPAIVPASRTRILPLAATLSIGLLVGFAVGYGVGSRDPFDSPDTSARSGQAPIDSPDTSARSGQAPVDTRTGVQPSTSATPAARDFSEQTIAPPSAGARQQPPTAAPAVPSEAPPAPRFATRPMATAGRIVVRSIPTRAAVTINGRWQGRTPLIVEKLPFGKYSVRVVQPGYTVAREEFALSIDDPARTLSVRLEPQPSQRASTDSARRPSVNSAPAPTTGSTRARGPIRPEPAARTSPETFTGSIFVDSRPRGARVFVDGRAVGTTPLSVPDVPIGSHVVRLELADHKPWTASRQVSAGQLERVTGSLERIR